MTTVELIYFSGCPNVSLARERLLQAFAATGITPQWQEWERDDPASPRHARAYGSPTVLVNGRDVTGMEPSGENAGACRVYSRDSSAFDGAPDAKAIATALRLSRVPAARDAGWRGTFAALPAVGKS